MEKASELKVETRKCGGKTVVLTIHGVLDAHTSSQLERRIFKLFDSGVHKIVADLSGVKYISSAGAGVLISGMQEASEKGGDFVFVKPSTSVKELFDLLGLASMFKSFPSVSEAIAHFTGR
ncbi:MAG: STAS domain-containing protein [Planctomycetota bacterium]|nr:STAS domain-containing protein [Planctomycetota bacterium]